MTVCSNRCGRRSLGTRERTQAGRFSTSESQTDRIGQSDLQQPCVTMVSRRWLREREVLGKACTLVLTEEKQCVVS